MPSLETNATVKTVQEIRLAPVLRKKLLTRLNVYAGLKAQRDAIDHAMKKAADEIGALRDETEEQSIKLEGFTVTLVAGHREKFNAKKFVQLGGDLAIYNQAKDLVPVKAYNRISTPNDKYNALQEQ